MVSIANGNKWSGGPPRSANIRIEDTYDTERLISVCYRHGRKSGIFNSLIETGR